MTERVKIRQSQTIEGNNVYFFSTALEQCTRKHLEPFIINKLSALEAKYKIIHSPVVAEYIQKHKSQVGDHPIDPILPLIFSNKKESSQTEILDFCERELPNRNINKTERETAFLDLCLILGDVFRAEQYDNRVKKGHDLLSILKANRGSLPDKLIEDEISIFWLKSNNTEDRELTIMIMRLIQNSQIGRISSWIAELWARGYHWDAICLGSILDPDSQQTANIKKKLPEILINENTNVWVNTAKFLIELENNISNTAANYESIEPILAYRIFKIEVSHFLSSNHQDSGLEYLSFVHSKSNLLQKIIGKLMVVEQSLAQGVGEDAVQFIKGILSHGSKVPFEEEEEPTEDDMNSTQSATTEEPITNTEAIEGTKTESAQTEIYGNSGSFYEKSLNWDHVPTQKPPTNEEGVFTEDEEEANTKTDDIVPNDDQSQNEEEANAKIDEIASNDGQLQDEEEASIKTTDIVSNDSQSPRNMLDQLIDKDIVQRPVETSTPQTLKSNTAAAGDRLSSPSATSAPFVKFSSGGFEEDSGFSGQFTPVQSEKSSGGFNAPYVSGGFGHGGGTQNGGRATFGHQQPQGFFNNQRQNDGQKPYSGGNYRGRNENHGPRGDGRRGRGMPAFR